MDGFFGIGFLELFFIAILALIVLGPERLPGVLREGAKYFRQLRNLTRDFTSQFSEELKTLDDINPQRILRELVEDPPPTPPTKPAAAQTKSSSKPTTPQPSKPAPSKPALGATMPGSEAPAASTAAEQEADNRILPPKVEQASSASESAPDNANGSGLTEGDAVGSQQGPSASGPEQTESGA